MFVRSAPLFIITAQHTMRELGLIRPRSCSGTVYCLIVFFFLSPPTALKSYCSGVAGNKQNLGDCSSNESINVLTGQIKTKQNRDLQPGTHNH